ncbi:MAG: YceI family protein [Acidobacteriota bacterium]
MKIFSSLLAALLFTTAFVSAETTYTIDPAHTNVNFSVSHMVISNVTGKFKDVSGTLVTSKEDFSDAKIAITIGAKSINTENEKRDEHLRSADFFNTEKYPEATFKSTSVTKAGKDAYRIAGELTMRGVTKPVVLDAVFKGKAKSPWGQTVAAFKGTTTIDRTAWGLTWNKALEAGGMLVGDEVELTFNVELIQK